MNAAAARKACAWAASGRAGISPPLRRLRRRWSWGGLRVGHGVAGDHAGQGDDVRE